MAYSPASIVAVSIVLPVIALVAVCLRFWVRLRVQPSYIGADDWLIAGAVVFSLADGANLAVAAILGDQGRYYAGDIPPERSNLESKSDYAQVILEKPLYGLMKLSVLFFFRRIFRIRKEFRRFNNLMIALVFAWMIAFTFAEAFECGVHPEVQWSGGKNSKAGCVDMTWMNFIFAITDVIGDIMVISMPYPFIKSLQMSKGEKFGLVSIFLLGALSTAASIIRFGFIAKAFTKHYGGAGNTHSSGTPPAVWSTIEGAIGVLAACLPPLGPLIKKAPSPHKASVTIYHRLLSHRKKSISKFQIDKTPSTADQTPLDGSESVESGTK